MVMLRPNLAFFDNRYVNVTGDTMTGNLVFAGTQKIIGGTTTTSDLSLQTTSGVGASGADMHFLVGNNGATEAMTILNSGNVGIGTVSPGTVLQVPGNVQFGTSLSTADQGANFVAQGNSNQPAMYVQGHSTRSGTNDVIFSMNRYGISGGFQVFGDHRAYFSGKVGIQDTAPTALLQLGAGTASANTAPVKLTTGTVLTTPEAGAIEFTTDNFYLTGTTGSTRKTINDMAYRAITALRTLDGSDNLVNCTSGTFTVTLPTAVGFTKEYIIVNSGTGIITLATTSSQTISGNATGTLTLVQWDTIVLRSDGANWLRIN